MKNSNHNDHDYKIKSIDKILNDTSYHIEYNGYLANHSKHAPIALLRLGANLNIINNFYNRYIKNTEIETQKKSDYHICEENWKEYLGKKSSFNSYYNFFKNKIEINGLSKVLIDFIPILIPGWMGSLAHGTIHLGWALDIKNKCMISEGLAYICYSFLSCHPEKIEAGTENTKTFDSPLESFLNILEDINKEPTQFKEYIQDLIDKEKIENNFYIHPNINRMSNQFKIAALLNYEHLLIYQDQKWFKNSNIDKVWDELFYLVTLIYLYYPSNFICLHLITSLHAIKEISFYLNQHEEQKCIKNYWIGMNCVLFSLESLPNKDLFKNLIKKNNNNFDKYDDPKIQVYWTQIIEKAYLEKEEHNPKLVYVLKKLWEENNFKSVFRLAAGNFIESS
ncbi:questin oxidase family protein [Silvanigrella aquatica]|uniref:Questin oxidase family protein n=1 Tax=Silvanigrella aquatica TaxID=1915309 RepID=A0A1L4CXZ4_9BACT|nr:questin oxidase family protein [Silvanigrella aquatica]APJ02815.1 hypothetical protein AXG55_02320 [Silvanigrella aquatica]